MKISMGAKMVYSVLCDHARDKDHCWPSHDSISKALNASVSSVKNWLNELRDNKLIAIDRRSYHSSRYYMLRPAHSCNSAATNALRPNRPKSDRFGQNLATEKNVKKELKENTSPFPPASASVSPPTRQTASPRQGRGDFLSVNRIFERFWAAYPKKEAKELARAVWHRLWRQGLLPDLEVMLKALERFRASAQWLKEHGRFVPQLVNWLKGQRWLDEDQGTALLSPEEQGRLEQAQKTMELFKAEQQEVSRQIALERTQFLPVFEEFLSCFPDGSKLVQDNQDKLLQDKQYGPVWAAWIALNKKGQAPKASDVPIGYDRSVLDFLRGRGLCYV